MKKILAFTCGALFMSANMAFAYTIKIFNNTDSDMKVEISYGGPGVCSPDTWKLSAQSTLERGVGGCCAKSNVKFTAMSGSLNGQIAYYDPPRTGMGLSCRSWTAQAVQIGTGFIVQTK